MDAAGTISELRLEIVELKAQLLVEGISEAREIAIRNQITALQNQITVLLTSLLPPPQPPQPQLQIAPLGKFCLVYIS
jgi:hypothetical protein